MERHSIIWRLKNYSNNSSDFIIFRVWGALNGSGRVKRKWRLHLEKVISKVDFFNDDHFFFFFREKLRRDIDLMLLHRDFQQIFVALRFFQLPVLSDDVIVVSGLCILKFTWAGNGNDIIRHDRKLKKSESNLLKFTMQKE